MKSIRVSLIVYFLVLMLLGLGGVSLLAYHSVAESSHDKNANDKHHLQIEFQGREQDIRKDFDEQLVNKARKVAGQLSWPNPIFLPNFLQLTNATVTPMGYLPVITETRFA